MIDVSFIIVSWNAKDYLLKCLESIHETVRTQSFEIIVVDNDSSDGSPESVASQYPETILIETGANLGFARANNVGLQASKGRYLCLLNSDTELMPNTIQILSDYMDKTPSVGMAAPRILNSDGSLQPTCSRFPELLRCLCSAIGLSRIFPNSALFGQQLITSWDYNEERFVDVLLGCFWFVRREAFNEVGPLDETFFMYGEDIDWCKSFHKKNWKLALYPEAEAIHYGGASSQNAPLQFYLALQGAHLTYWRKHHGSVSTLLRVLILLMHQSVRILGRLLIYPLFPANRTENAAKIRRSLMCVLWLIKGAPQERAKDMS